MRKKYLIPLSIALVVITGGCAKEVEQEPFERYSYIEDEEKGDIWTVDADGASLSIVPKTTQIIYKDKNGQEWYSIPKDLESVGGYNKELVCSNLIIEYSNDVGNANSYGSYQYSVQKGLYEIEQIDGDTPGFDIHYTIGNIKRQFKFPQVMTEEEYDQWKETLDAIDTKYFKKYLRENYDLYDINKLPKGVNKEELLAQYPTLAEKKLYVLLDTTQDHVKATMEGIFEEAGFDDEAYEAYKEEYSIKEEARSTEFNITLQVRLVDGDLQATVPMDSLKYYIGYYPIHLDVLPFMGASTQSDDGYMIVPDGSGAVINFNNAKTDQSPYNSLVYGWDDAILRSAVVDDSVSPYGVFGIVYKGSEETEDKPAQDKRALLGIVTDGQAFSTIEADISGRNGSGEYNNAFASFDLLHYSDLDVTGRSEHTVRLFEETWDEGTEFQVLYRSVDSDSYVDVAASYRDYLMETYDLKKLEGDKIPVVIEGVAAVDTIDQVVGIPTTITLPLTTYKEADAMIKDLKDSGVDFDFKYSGWFNGGVSNKTAEKVRTNSGLGSAGTLKSMVTNAENQGVNVYLDAYFQYIYRDKFIDSYSAKRDSSRYLGREVIKMYPFSPIWFGTDQEDKTKITYLSKPEYWKKSAENYAKTIDKKFGASGIAYEDLGYRVNADYNDKNRVSRQTSMEMQAQLLKDMKDQEFKVLTKGGNDFTLPYADVITDMWTYSKLYNIEDYSIPFYEIALHGLKNYTGNSLNISNDYQKSLLYCIETGSGLYYTVMDAEVSELADTTYTSFYGTDYSRWKDTIVSDIKKVQSELGSTADQFITGYEILADGVTQTTYENGVKVIVNYSFQDYEEGNIKVASREYIVLGGDK